MQNHIARLSAIPSAMLDSLSDGILVADAAGKILFANRSAIKISGGGRNDVPPSEWSATYGFTIPGSDQPFPPARLPLARAIRGETIYEEELFIRNSRVPDGAWVSVSGGPVFNEDGSISGGVVTFRDITRHKAAEAHSSRLASAVSQTADAVMITDRAGTIEYVNPAFESTTGHTKQDAVGQTPRILKSGAQGPEYYREMWQTILAGKTFRGMTVNRKKSGELYHAEQSITPMIDTEGQISHFVSVFKDMTERREIQEREIEMQVAARVQRHLFPASAPTIEGYDIAGSVFPAQATCGDYFDFVAADDGSLCIVVADACGHGIGPALVMVETRAWVRSLARRCDDPCVVLNELNRVLHDDLDDRNFVTMLLTFLDHHSGRVSFANAGHPGGFIIDESGGVRRTLGATGVPLGMFPDHRYTCGDELVLGPGELMVLVTDGILESLDPDGTEFEVSRLTDVVRENRHRPAREIVDRVRLAVDDFAQGTPQSDDLSIIICKRDPAAD